MAQNNAQEERHPDQRRDDAHRNDHPGHQIFRRHRGHRQHQCANQRAGRQIETVIFAEDHACDVRRHQADKADRPDEGHRQRRENADAQQRGQPQTAHVDAEAHGPVFTQTQRGQFPRAHHRQRQQHGEYAEQDAQLVPRGARQAAHGPEHQPLQRVLAGDELHHRYQRVEGKHQRDAEQHHAGGGNPRPARDAVEHQRGEQRKDKGVGGDEPLIGNARNADAEHDRQRGAKGRGGRHAEGKGAGQRVIQDGLHFRPGQAKRKAHHHRHQRVRQADVPDDHPRAGIGRGGIEQRLP